jgi:hypothetical protein
MTTKTKINFFPYLADGVHYEDLGTIPQNAASIIQTKYTFQDFIANLTIKDNIGQGTFAQAYRAEMKMPNQQTKNFVLRKLNKDNRWTILNNKLIYNESQIFDPELRTYFSNNSQILITLFSPFKKNNTLFDTKTFSLTSQVPYSKVHDLLQKENELKKHPGFSYLHKFEYIDVDKCILFSEEMDGDVYNFYYSETRHQFVEKNSKYFNAKFMLQFQLQTGLALDYCFGKDVYLTDFKPPNVLYKILSNNNFHFKITDFDHIPFGTKFFNLTHTATEAYQLPGLASFRDTGGHIIFASNVTFVAWIFSFFQLWFIFFNRSFTNSNSLKQEMQNPYSQGFTAMQQTFPYILDILKNFSTFNILYYINDDTPSFKNTLSYLINLYNRHTTQPLNWNPSTN